MATGEPGRRHTETQAATHALAGQPGPWLRRHAGHLRRFPDAHLGWAPFALMAGLRLAHRVDLLYSSSGPFTCHLVGLILHRLTGRPWVAELRDGWYRWNRAIFPDYPAWRGPLEARLEAMAIRGAGRVVLVTERMAQAFRDQYPDLPACHFGVVPNGFDPAQQPGRADSPWQPPGGRADAWLSGDAHEPGRADSPWQPRSGLFEVVHAGALYYGRPIGGFLAAARRLATRDAEFGASLRLRLVGSLDATARAELAAAGLGDRVQVDGTLDHAAALRAERAADVLLLVANTTPGAEATVPGKLFEYLASGRPVLAVAPRVSASAEVLARTGGGWLADAAEPESIERALQAAYQAHRAGAVVRPDPAEVARYDRRRLAGELAHVFDAALGRG